MGQRQSVWPHDDILHSVISQRGAEHLLQSLKLPLSVLCGAAFDGMNNNLRSTEIRQTTRLNTLKASPRHLYS